MIFYHYDLDGFTHTEDDAWVFEGANLVVGLGLEVMLQTAGWHAMLLHGRGDGRHLIVYRHRDGAERGLYVNVSYNTEQVFGCLVKPRAWPQFYRAELLPIAQAYDASSLAHGVADIAAGLGQLVGVLGAASPGTPPVETPPGKPK